MNKNILLAGLYFALAAALSLFFIMEKFWLVSSVGILLLYAGIGAVNWSVQVIAALVFFKTQKWIFIRNTAWIAFVGSGVLYLYYLFPFFSFPGSGFLQFRLSIVLSVVVMDVLYYRSVTKMKLPISWFWGWMIALFVTTAFQLKILFI